MRAEDLSVEELLDITKQQQDDARESGLDPVWQMKTMAELEKGNGSVHDKCMAVKDFLLGGRRISQQMLANDELGDGGELRRTLGLGSGVPISDYIGKLRNDYDFIIQGETYGSLVEQLGATTGDLSEEAFALREEIVEQMTSKVDSVVDKKGKVYWMDPEDIVIHEEDKKPRVARTQLAHQKHLMSSRKGEIEAIQRFWLVITGQREQAFIDMGVTDENQVLRHCYGIIDKIELQRKNKGAPLSFL